MDVVEVSPTGVGSADITALVAERIVREALTGVALRRGAKRSDCARAGGACACALPA